MKIIYSLLIGLFCTISLIATNVSANVATAEDKFIQKMANDHGFDRRYLQDLFRQSTVSQPILDAISKPAEKKLVWHEYRKIFITEKRINKGAQFWQKYQQTLQKAEQTFGVDAEIIVAIIGVETFYGKFAGKHRVFDALNTLAFHYPNRASFFLRELEEFLLLTREQRFEPMSLMGSYAGAMGLPQFISSSYRHYAVDFDGDNKVDIWNSPHDAIGSVANYLYKHGWQKDKLITSMVTVSGSTYKQLLTPGLKLDITASDLKKHGITPKPYPHPNEKLKLFKYQLKAGDQYWLAYKNFYAITRYNHSSLYAMAVYQLALAIKDKVSQTTAH